MQKGIIKFFDKMEDILRAKLSRIPIVYALLGGIGVVLFWRGVWHTTDSIVNVLLGDTFSIHDIFDGPLSFVIGTFILLATGVFVSSFIGNRLIITGLNGEKKLAEKTKEEITTEDDKIQKMEKTLEKVKKELENIEYKITRR